MMQYEFSKTCSFEQDINDTSLEHDAVSTRFQPGSTPKNSLLISAVITRINGGQAISAFTKS